MSGELWAYVGPEFGTSWKHGCCNAVVVTTSGRTTVCGWPRSDDGSCGDGHPAQPPEAELVRLRVVERLVPTTTTPPGEQ